MTDQEFIDKFNTLPENWKFNFKDKMEIVENYLCKKLSNFELSPADLDRVRELGK